MDLVYHPVHTKHVQIYFQQDSSIPTIVKITLNFTFFFFFSPLPPPPSTSACLAISATQSITKNIASSLNYLVTLKLLSNPL